MSCIRVSVRTLLLASSVCVAAVASPGLAPAAVQPSSATSSLDQVVIRGSSETTASTLGGNDPPPVVLRGSRPPPAVPPVDYACPAGYFYDPTSGCVMAGYAYEPYGYDYWPYWGFDGFYFGKRRHLFPHGFARRGPVVHLGRPAVNGFGHGFAHIGGFGHR